MLHNGLLLVKHKHVNAMQALKSCMCLAKAADEGGIGKKMCYDDVFVARGRAHCLGTIGKNLCSPRAV